LNAPSTGTGFSVSTLKKTIRLFLEFLTILSHISLPDFVYRPASK
jgi:hypothetical protein